MWQTINWICALVGMVCSTMPDLAVIQSAYDREESAGSKLHDKDLEVLQSKCHDEAAEQYLCEVTFISRGDPSQRLYFDIVAIAHESEGWVLKSGLCKR
jgi:hypothetical protein